jgi:hypothetical protein
VAQYSGTCLIRFHRASGTASDWYLSIGMLWRPDDTSETASDIVASCPPKEPRSIVGMEMHVCDKYSSNG